MRRFLTLALLAAAVAASPLAGQDTTIVKSATDGYLVDFQDQDIRIVIDALTDAAGINVSYANLPNRRVTWRVGTPIQRSELVNVLADIVASQNMRMSLGSGGVYTIETVQTGRGGNNNATTQATVPAEVVYFIFPLKHANNELLAATLTNAFAATGGRGGGGGRGNANANTLLQLNTNQNQGRGGGRGGGGGGGRGGGRGGGGDQQDDQQDLLDPTQLSLGANLLLNNLTDEQQQDVREARAALQQAGADERRVAAEQLVQQLGGQIFTAQGGAANLAQLFGGQAAAVLQAAQQGQGTDPRFVAVQGTNQLIIRAAPSDVPIIQAVIQSVDLRPLQVLIEVSIVEVRRSADLQIGVSAAGNYTKEGETQPRATAELQQPTALDNARSFILELTGGRGTVDYNVAINALATRGDVRVASLPIIFAQNNRQAQLIVGEQRPFVQTTQLVPNDNGVVNQIVQYRDVATTLTLLPTINPDGYVNLEVSQVIDGVTNEIAFDAPVLSRRQATTSLFVRTGQTAVIGGLASKTSDKTRSGIPVLSSIPIIGGLFGYTRNTDVVTELFLFLTPHIVQTDEDTDRMREAVQNRLELLQGIDLRQIIPRPDTTINIVIPPDTATVTNIPRRDTTRVPPDTGAARRIPPDTGAARRIPPDTGAARRIPPDTLSVAMRSERVSVPKFAVSDATRVGMNGKPAGRGELYLSVWGDGVAGIR